MILDQFRHRKLKGSSEDSKGSHPHVSTQVSSGSNAGAEKVAKNSLRNEGESTIVVANFKELGVSEDLAEVLGGDWCKSVLLSSPADPDRIWPTCCPLFRLIQYYFFKSVHISFKFCSIYIYFYLVRVLLW